MPEIGDIAPDFTLQETFDTSVTLSDYRGKQNVLLFFHPFSYTEICEGEICEPRDESKLQRDDREILNVARDAAPTRWRSGLSAWGTTRSPITPASTPMPATPTRTRFSRVRALSWSRPSPSASARTRRTCVS